MSHRIKTWWERLNASMTDPNQLTAHPWLKPIAKRIIHPSLWRPRREALARGAAVGAFWAFVLPVGQIVVAVAHCSMWRANIPTAALMTMITNPLTIGFWLWIAYHFGSWFLGSPATDAIPVVGAEAQTWLSTYGHPVILGMSIFAFGGAILSYIVVKMIWRMRVWLKLRQRKYR